MQRNESTLPLVAASEPYPKIEVSKPNLRYAHILSQDFASAKGEMTAIFEYLYQHWILGNIDSEFAKLLARIAVVEMHHLDILGQLIVLLGGTPQCASIQHNRPIVWNGGMMNYTKQLKDMLTFNLYLEQSAIDAYTAHARGIEDPNVSAILLRIVQDERIHLQIFQDTMATLTQ